MKRIPGLNYIFTGEIGYRVRRSLGQKHVLILQFKYNAVGTHDSTKYNFDVWEDASEADFIMRVFSHDLKGKINE